MIATPALNKVLKHHSRYCTYWVFSGDRHCSCGRDQALEELQKLLDEIEKLQRQVNSVQLPLFAEAQ